MSECCHLVSISEPCVLCMLEEKDVEIEVQSQSLAALAEVNRQYCQALNARSDEIATLKARIARIEDLADRLDAAADRYASKGPNEPPIPYQMRQDAAAIRKALADA